MQGGGWGYFFADTPCLVLKHISSHKDFCWGESWEFLSSAVSRHLHLWGTCLFLCLCFRWPDLSPRAIYAIEVVGLWAFLLSHRLVLCFRVNQHPGTLLQHLLNVLSHWTGYLAGLLSSSLLQGQEADWVEEGAVSPLWNPSRTLYRPGYGCSTSKLICQKALPAGVGSQSGVGGGEGEGKEIPAQKTMRRLLNYY